MKNGIIILLMLVCSNIAYAEEAIILEPDTYLEKSINLEAPNQELMERGVQNLNNNGVILKNSISPVKGLIYNSTSIPSERKLKENTQTNEE